MTQFLGTEAQRAFLARGRAMHVLTRDDPAYTYYGRGVGLAAPEPSGIARVAALTRLQGYANIDRVPADAVPALRAEAEAAGFVVKHYARWNAGEEALRRSEALAAEIALPEGLTVEAIDGGTSDAALDAFEAMALGCGVLPPALDALTGTSRPGVCLVAREADGRVVSCAGAAAFFHADHPHRDKEGWWGMLATDPSRRGARLSLALGARAMVEMRDRFGFTLFMTGVEPGNAPSEAVCAKLGLSDSGDVVFGLSDPALLPGGRMTK